MQWLLAITLVTGRLNMKVCHEKQFLEKSGGHLLTTIEQNISLEVKRESE